MISVTLQVFAEEKDQFLTKIICLRIELVF